MDTSAVKGAYPRGDMRALIVVVVLAGWACGDDGAPVADAGSPDAAVDGGRPDGGAPDAGPGPPPACEPLPPVAPPACGSGEGAANRLLPGPGRSGHDAALAGTARRLDRGFRALHAWSTGANAERTIPSEDDRALVTRFLLEDDGWDFATFAGRGPETLGPFWKVAGAYAGAGVAADAFRYATLRDEGAPCDEVERARAHLAADLDVLHLATAITGVPGVVARGFIRRDHPGGDLETTPLFDEDGSPLPAEKDNGTWREDQSGDYPDLLWEDSCSRDMLIGWVLGMASAWEVVARDPSFEAAVVRRLEEDAAAVARSLMRVGEEGYDLEIRDADGRRTFHGLLHESAIDRVYLRGLANGQHAAMALGIVAALARVSGDPEVASYLHEQLVVERDLPGIVRDHAKDVDFGVETNFSNYNMAFTGAWLAHRYLCDEPARRVVREGTTAGLYDTPGADRQPVEQSQSFYDLVFLAAHGGATVNSPLSEVDEAALSRALASLRDFEAPLWDTRRDNCDATEIAAGVCVADDGSEVVILGPVGRGGEVVAETPLPLAVRPPSNYHWRSDPYRVNGGGSGAALYPGADFRLAYWMGRHLRR